MPHPRTRTQVAEAQVPSQPNSENESESEDDLSQAPAPLLVDPAQQFLPPMPPMHAPQPMQSFVSRPVQYIKHLPTFVNGSDLLIFLQRFNSYCQALRISQEMKDSLLVAHLDDTSLRGISRHLRDNPSYDEIVQILKKSQGYDANNTEKHITDMAARKRLKSEKVMDYFIDLSRMSELAYPKQKQAEIRDAKLRQEFIKNINYPMIAARLREHSDISIEELLDLAIKLESCFEASKITPTQVHFMDQEEIANIDTTATKLNNLTDMVEKLVINQVDRDNIPDTSYEY